MFYVFVKTYERTVDFTMTRLYCMHLNYSIPLKKLDDFYYTKTKVVVDSKITHYMYE